MVVLELLFRISGFTVERQFGSYDMRAIAPTSPLLIVIGRRD